MSQAARITGILLSTLALGGFIVAQFVPFEAKSFAVGNSTRHYESTPWVREAPAGTQAWYGSALGSEAGANLVRVAAPLLVVGMILAVAVCVLLILQRRRLAGIAGVVGSLAAGTGVVLLSLGLDRHFRADKDLGVPLDFAGGFYVAMAAVVLLLAASIFAFVALAEETSRKRIKGLPARPSISVDNPQAFNPMQSEEARPFKADPERELRGFEVTGGNRAFRADTPTKPVPGPKVSQTQQPAPKPNPPARPAPPAGAPATASGTEGKRQPAKQPAKQP